MEEFVQDCSDGDEEPLIVSAGGGLGRVGGRGGGVRGEGGGGNGNPCRWQKSVHIKDYGMWNMCSCLCCCCIIALVGIYKSFKCQSAKRRGEYRVAERYSRQARVVFWVSFSVGVLLWIIIAAAYGFLIVTYLKLMTGGGAGGGDPGSNSTDYGGLFRLLLRLNL